jgi:hypothetical protein
MAAMPEREELHRLVDRLTPGQARQLLRLAKSDPAVAGDQDSGGPGPQPGPGTGDDALRRFKSFVGIIDSGRGDLSERHEEIIREHLTGRV